MDIEIHQIKEIYDGHYHMILDFPTLDILNQLLDRSYQYVWGINYQKYGCEWEKESFDLFEKDCNGLYVRNMCMDFLMSTSDFLEKLPYIKNTLHIVQINKKPPYYLDPNRIKGKIWYDLLKKDTDYLFEIELPCSSLVADYTEIVSSKFDFLDGIKKNIVL